MFVKNAIAYYRNQTFLSRRLLIVYEGTTSLSVEDSSAGWSDISFIKLPDTTLTLGARRNYAIERCETEFFCIWDDDDWHHPQRLEVQIQNLLSTGKPSNVLSRVMLFDALQKQMYLSSERYWEGTLLCRRDIFSDNIRYGLVNKGEDDDLLSKLKKRELVSLTTAPYLYTYVYHGNNTWDENHFRRLFSAGYPVE